LTGILRALREVCVSFAASDLLVLCHHEVRSCERFHDQMSVLLERGYSLVTIDLGGVSLIGAQVPDQDRPT
jgi:hypothetical protein